MRKRQTERQKIHKIIVGSLRETIRTHGPITKSLVGSAAKRIAGTLLAKGRKNDESNCS